MRRARSEGGYGSSRTMPTSQVGKLRPKRTGYGRISNKTSPSKPSLGVVLDYPANRLYHFTRGSQAPCPTTCCGRLPFPSPQLPAGAYPALMMPLGWVLANYWIEGEVKAWRGRVPCPGRWAPWENKVTCCSCAGSRTVKIGGRG